MSSTVDIGILLFPEVTQLDATGPAQVLARVPGATVHLIWKNLDPVATDAGFSIVPTTTFEAAPKLDVLLVPGGAGQIPLMTDAETLGFLRVRAKEARFITSVCTGSLLLAAAGLLKGYKATSHWAWRDMLSALGAYPVNARVVRDRNRITGGGVTAGIDFGLTLAAELAGEEAAKMIQLTLEYAPDPPFDCGTPERAGKRRVAAFRKRAEKTTALREEAVRAATAREQTKRRR